MRVACNFVTIRDEKECIAFNFVIIRDEKECKEAHEKRLNLTTLSETKKNARKLMRNVLI